MKRVLAVLLLSFASLGCVYFLPDYTVTPSFTVHVSNRYGPVVGLLLRATRPKDVDLSGLIPEELRARLTNEQVVRIEEATTDANGDAHFHLDRLGHWYLGPETPAANALDAVNIYVDPSFSSEPVSLRWPRSSILDSKQLHGQLSDGLETSRYRPLKQTTLILHSFVTLAEIAATKTGDDGSYQFDGVPTGLYFLGINSKEESTSTIYPQYPKGYIPVFIGVDSPREQLSIVTESTDCGLLYDLEENLFMHKPMACFQGAKPVPCE